MLIVTAAVVVLSAVYVILQRVLSPSSSIPVVPGIPVLGNAIALARGGLAYITQCRQTFGDVFCLRVFGQSMVFVFDPAMITQFFKAPESTISFKPAVERFTQRIYGLPSQEFFAVHEDLLTTLRQLLVPSQLQAMGLSLISYAQPHLERWKEQGQVELWSACQSLVFGAAGQVLFGPAFFQRHGLEVVQQTFLDFEGSFEVAASPIPHLLLPKFRRSRRALLSMFSVSVTAGDFEGTIVEQLLQGDHMSLNHRDSLGLWTLLLCVSWYGVVCFGELRSGLAPQRWPNLLLAVLWASQANSMPAMFWCLALLLLPQHAAAKAQVLQEVQDVAHTVRLHNQQQPLAEDTQPSPAQQQLGLDAATVSAMLQLALDRKSWVSCCVAEAIRLRAHSIAVRFVAGADVCLAPSRTSTSSSSSSCHPTTGSARAHSAAHWKLPRASILCICPVESHHDKELYPDEPFLFNPKREAIQGLEPGTVVPSIAGMGFGGGFWRCPGRFFAEMELALLLQLVVQCLLVTPQVQASVQSQSQLMCDRGWKRSRPPGRGGLLHRCPVFGGLMQLLTDKAVFGIGMFGGCSRQTEDWAARSMVGPTTCTDSVRLPRSNLQRLVGFKVPVDQWWVRVDV